VNYETRARAVPRFAGKTRAERANLLRRRNTVGAALLS
jgi:hypothetical protein